MELVYLWVEEYKNIENEGFSFSSNYECEFTPVYEDGKFSEKSELKVNPKENNLKCFFDKGINITAIVGENGSGKSNLMLLQLISLFQYEKYKNKIKNLFMLYKMDSKFILCTNSSVDIILNIKSEKLDINNSKNLNEYISSIYSLFIDFTLRKIDLENDKSNYKTNYALEPSRLHKSAESVSILSKVEPISFDSNMRINILYFYYYLYKNKLENILENFGLPNFDNLIYKSSSSRGTGIKEEVFESIKQKEIFDIDFSQFNSYDEINHYFRNKSFMISIKGIKEEDLIKIEELLVFINLEPSSINNLKFSSISSGQQNLLSYIGMIIRSHLYLKATERKTLNIYIDEFENSLHPNWQKKFLDFIIKMIVELEINQKYIINIQISTHSPFLLSDLPKGNVIFLEKDEKTGECINVSDKVDINPFGANIHTLLSHGFFMKDGLMGEFAKDKITEVIKFLKSEDSTIQSKEEAKNIIEIIGEPFLKDKLMKMYNDKFKTNDEKIRELETEIERLKNA